MKVYVVLRNETTLLESEVVGVTTDFVMAQGMVFHDYSHCTAMNYPVYLSGYEIVEKDLAVVEHNPL